MTMPRELFETFALHSAHLLLTHDINHLMPLFISSAFSFFFEIEYVTREFRTFACNSWMNEHKKNRICYFVDCGEFPFFPHMEIFLLLSSQWKKWIYEIFLSFSIFHFLYIQFHKNNFPQTLSNEEIEISLIKVILFGFFEML